MKKKVLVHRSLLDSVFNGLLNGGVSVRVRKLYCQDGTHPLELFLCMFRLGVVRLEGLE